MRICRTRLIAAAFAAAAVGPAWAGPDIVEDCAMDVGSFPGTALPARGPGPTVSKLVGCLSGLPLVGPPDLEDMYLINIADPAGFLAMTMAGDGTDDDDTTFPSQLWLFSGPDLPPPEGRGLLGNQQAMGLPQGSARLGNMSNDGTGIVIDQPGLYYIAISEFNNVPQTGGADIFMFAVPGEVSGPDGPGGGDQEIDNWSGETMGMGGQYTIFLNGVVPVPLIPGDTNGDDVVDVNDLNNVFLDWDTNGAKHGGDIVGQMPGDPPDGIVDVNDLNAVIFFWSFS